jgi:hypothetical protein
MDRTKHQKDRKRGGQSQDESRPQGNQLDDDFDQDSQSEQGQEGQDRHVAEPGESQRPGGGERRPKKESSES